jgi:hypothetical protein
MALANILCSDAHQRRTVPDDSVLVRAINVRVRACV